MFRMYIAFGIGPNGGPISQSQPSLKNSMEEAVEWAKKFLGDKPGVEKVMIFENIGLVVREAPPIRFVPIEDTPKANGPSLSTLREQPDRSEHLNDF